jgi:hypothetical protein
MEISGTIVTVMEAVNVSKTGSEFMKREFVLEYIEDKPEYPQLIKFELIKDRCTLVNGLQNGDKVTVSYNLQGRKWTSPQGEDKYFTTLQAWRIVTDPAGAETPDDPREVASNSGSPAASSLAEIPPPF